MSEFRKNPRLEHAIAQNKERLRMNKGRQMLPNWMRQFETATSCVVNSSDFLDTMATKQLRTQFIATIKHCNSCQVIEWPVESFDTVINYLEELDRRIGPVDVYLLSDVDAYIGALHTQSTHVLRNVQAVWDVVHHDIGIVSLDAVDGLCLEFNYCSIAGGYNRDGFYLLTSWGRFNMKEIGV